MEWQIEYAVHDRKTGVDLRVWSPNGTSWFWSVWDDESDDGAVSALPGFETKEEAMQAAENYFKGGLVRNMWDSVEESTI